MRILRALVAIAPSVIEDFAGRLVNDDVPLGVAT
jgi:hypothetical protein